MKYLISLFSLFLLALPLNAQETNHDWSGFYQLKNGVKSIIESEAKHHGDATFSVEEEAMVLKLNIERELQNLSKKTPFKFDVFYQKPPKEGQIVPELVLTTVAKYEDEKGEIVWGFNVVFYDYKIEFYSINQLPVTPGNSYNYLTLYKA